MYSHVTDLNARNKRLTAKRIYQDYQYHKDRKTFLIFFYLNLYFSNVFFFSSKMYDQCDDFDFDIVSFPFLCGDIPRHPTY